MVLNLEKKSWNVCLNEKLLYGPRNLLLLRIQHYYLYYVNLIYPSKYPCNFNMLPLVRIFYLICVVFDLFLVRVNFQYFFLLFYELSTVVLLHSFNTFVFFFYFSIIFPKQLSVHPYRLLDFQFHSYTYYKYFYYCDYVLLLFVLFYTSFFCINKVIIIIIINIFILFLSFNLYAISLWATWKAFSSEEWNKSVHKEKYVSHL